MPRPSEPFSPGVLSLLRAEAGLTVARLADAVGVSQRQIIYYEQGRHSPAPARLKRLAEVLGTSPQRLSGVPRGQETLTDLRRFAGLNRAEAARLLAERVPGTSMWKLQAAESGIAVQGWADSDVLGRVITALAGLYGVPVPTIRRAWLRAFPQQADLLRHRRVARRAAGPMTTTLSGASRDWHALNERQRTYLTVCFHEDQAAEARARAEHAAGRDPGPASVWRKLPFTIKADPTFTGHTEIQLRLKEQGLLDAGAGASLAVLVRRRLIVLTEDQVEVFPLGPVNRLLVELTRKGRACARAGLDRPAPARTPAHLLSAWLWESLIKVASAGTEGLPEADLWGKARFFLGCGFRPHGAASRGYIDLVPVRAEVDEGSYVREYRWHLTVAGRRHLHDFLDAYRSEYPQVETGELKLDYPTGDL